MKEYFVSWIKITNIEIFNIMKEEEFWKIRNFAIRIMNGEVLDSPEELQFYLNYREEIEKMLKGFSDEDNIFNK